MMTFAGMSCCQFCGFRDSECRVHDAGCMTLGTGCSHKRTTDSDHGHSRTVDSDCILSLDTSVHMRV